MTDENKEKKKKRSDSVEWAFDFSDFGESLNRFFGSLSGDEEVQTTSVKALLQDATNAEIELEFAVGVANINALATDSDSVIEGDLRHIGEIEFDVEGEEIKRVSLQPKKSFNNVGSSIRQGFRALADRDDLRWDIALTPRVPLMLDVEGGVGPVTLDLTGLTITHLEVDSGVGQMTITLPAQDAMLAAEVDSGVGQTTLTVPDDFDGRVDIDAGVGLVEVYVPAGLAVQLTYESGIGGMNLPENMKRVSGKSEFMENNGVWQTEGFDLAQRRLVLNVEAGVGQFRIRHVAVV